MKTYLALLTSALLAAATAFAADRNPLMNAYLQANMSAKNDAGTPFSILDLAGLSFSDAAGIRTIAFGSTNGVKLGATGDKLGFFGATPIIRPSGDVGIALVNLGLIDSPTLSGTLISGGEGTMDLSGYDITLPSDMLLQLRRGNYAELQTIALAAGEPGWTNDTHELFVGDGTLAGGHKVGISRQAGTTFTPPLSATVPDMLMFSNTATNGSSLYVQYVAGKWLPFWSVKPATSTGTTSATAPGTFISVVLGATGAATSTGVGGAPGTAFTTGVGSLFSLTSGSGGGTSTAFDGGGGGKVGTNIAHQIRFQAGTGGAAGSGANGGSGGDGGLGISSLGGAGGAGGTATGATGGNGGHSRPAGATSTGGLVQNGGAGGTGGTEAGAIGGGGGQSGKITQNGGAGGNATTTQAGDGGLGGQIIQNGGAGSAPGSGGSGGWLTQNGSAATPGVDGARGGNITTNGNASYRGGDIDMSAQTGYDGPDVKSVVADPEGTLTAPVGSVARDVANGVAYFKQTGTGNTGWLRMGQRVRTVPANSAAAGAAGQWFSDDSYFYYYGATGWRRIAGSTF